MEIFLGSIRNIKKRGRKVKMKIDIETPVEEFEREHKITDIILLGEDGSVRRVILE